jgi:hypothetical protein
MSLADPQPFLAFAAGDHNEMCAAGVIADLGFSLVPNWFDLRAASVRRTDRRTPGWGPARQYPRWWVSGVRVPGVRRAAWQVALFRACLPIPGDARRLAWE